MYARDVALTLGNLLEEQEFGFEIVSGDERALCRPVAGVHSIEIANPVRFLQEDWVMLCNGVRLKGKPKEQRQLVAQLETGGITALGFGLGEFFNRTPSALLSEAKSRGFPMFVIKRPIPFREIIAYVNQATLSHNVYHVRRAMAIQNQLLEDVVRLRSDRTVLARLAEALHGEATLLTADGVEEISVGEPPVDAIWSELKAGSRTEQRFEAGDRHVTAVPVLIDGRLHRWLVVTRESGPDADQLARRVLVTAQRLLQLLERGRAGTALEDKALRAELLGWLLEDPPEVGPGVLRRRSERFGLDPEAGGRIFLFALAREAVGNQAREELRMNASEALQRELTWLSSPYLFADLDRGLAVYAQSELDVDGLTAALAEQSYPFLVGVGRNVDSLESLPESHRDAQVALSELSREGKAPTILRFEDFGLADALVSTTRKLVTSRADDLLGELRDHENLYVTLLAYLDADLDISRTAASLHLHPNSLRYRLSRIEQLLDRSLSNVRTIADLYLATTAERDQART